MTFEAFRKLGPSTKQLKEKDLNRLVRSILKYDIGVPFSKEVRGWTRRAPSRKSISPNPLRIDFILYPTEWMYREGIQRPIFVELKKYDGSWGKALAQASDYRMAGFEIVQTGDNAITNFAYEHCLTQRERANGRMYPERVFVMPDLSGRVEATIEQLERDPKHHFRSRTELLFGTGSVDIIYEGGSLFFTAGGYPIMAIREDKSCEVFEHGRDGMVLRCS